jgi:hypothetical protein
MDGGTRIDLGAAQTELSQALALPAGEGRVRAARQVLLRHGASVLGLDPARISSLADLIRRMSRAPPSPGRRRFAVLLIHGLAEDGLLGIRSGQPRPDRDLCGLVEAALPDVLRRSSYPFGDDPAVRCRALAELHRTIDEHLRPLEPTFPDWLTGLPKDAPR